jgi:hypothetical protein
VGWPSEWITLENPVLVAVGFVDMWTRAHGTPQRNQSSHTIVVLAAIKKQQLRTNGGCLTQKKKRRRRCAREGGEMQLKLTPTPIGWEPPLAPSRYMRRPTRNSPFLRCIGEKQGRCMRVDSVAAITASSPDPVCLLSACVCLFISSD